MMITQKAYQERSDSSQGNSKILALTLNSYNLWSLKKMLELKEDKMNMGIIAPRGGGQKKKSNEKEEAKNSKSCGGTTWWWWEE